MAESEQKLAALAKANAIRTRRAELKHHASAGETPLWQLLTSPPPDWLRTADVFRTIQGQRGVGRATARKAMRRAEIPIGATFGSLTPRARRALLDELARAISRRWL
jgi:hypothetical protein